MQNLDVDWQVPCKHVLTPPSAEQSTAQLPFWVQMRFGERHVLQLVQQGAPSRPHSEPPEPLGSGTQPPVPAIPPAPAPAVPPAPASG